MRSKVGRTQFTVLERALLLLAFAACVLLSWVVAVALVQFFAEHLT
jgi:hypothetical protein